MFQDYKDKQSLFYNYIMKSISNNKISHAYLLETKGVSYSFFMALALSKLFLLYGKDSFEQERLSFLIDNGNYPDLIVIDNDKEIKKEEIINLQERFSVKPLYGDYLIYIIKDASLLNQSSSNALLKFLEEPNPNVIAILLTSNMYKVMDTIVSRCQCFSLVPEEPKMEDIITMISLNSNILIDDIVSFYVDLETFGTSLIARDPYKYRDNIKQLLDIGLYLYMDILHNKSLETPLLFKDYGDKIKIIIEKNTNDDIIKKIEIINLFRFLIDFNVNKDLFIDNFIISFGG